MKRHKVRDEIMDQAYQAAKEMYGDKGFLVYRGGHHIAVVINGGDRFMLATDSSSTTLSLQYY